jgi:hypothetical protein
VRIPHRISDERQIASEKNAPEEEQKKDEDDSQGPKVSVVIAPPLSETFGDAHKSRPQRECASNASMMRAAARPSHNAGIRRS